MRKLGGFLLALVLACASPALAQDLLRVHFFDVGQGDAVLIQAPSGQNVVYDGGERADGLLRHLKALGVQQLDLVVASHNHADHIGGLAEVVREFRPRFYMDNGIPATTLTYQRVLEAVKDAGSQLLEPTARRITLGEVVLNILPPPGRPGWEQNDNSVGMVVEFGEFRLSLGGDAEHRQWAWRIENQQLPRVHVHKASHHGSRNGDTQAGIERLSPEVVVISAGSGNRYGHPSPEALRLYEAQGASVYRTDLHGTVLIEAEASGRYTVRVERGEGARPPTAPIAVPPSSSCIDINSASLEDIQRITHIGSARAQQILALRPFRSVEELRRIDGIGDARLRDILAQGLACVR